MATGSQGQILPSDEFENVEINNLIIRDADDPTKRLQFALTDVPTGTTVVLTVPSASATIGESGGQQQLVFNNSGGSIAAFTVVQIDGHNTAGDIPTVAKTSAVTDTAFGILSANVDNQETATITNNGQLTTTGFDTKTANVGDPVFFVGLTGALTLTPSGSAQIGIVTKADDTDSRVFFNFSSPGSSQIDSGGAANLPSLAVEGDHLTGIYSAGTGELDIAVTGVQQLSIDDTRVSVKSVLSCPSRTTASLTGAYVDGDIVFDSTRKTLVHYDSAADAWSNIQEESLVFNSSGGVIAALTVVRIDGYNQTADVLAVTPTTNITDNAVGLIQTSTPNQETTTLVKEGQITTTGFDTSAANVGDPVFFVGATGALSLAYTGSAQIGTVTTVHATVSRVWFNFNSTTKALIHIADGNLTDAANTGFYAEHNDGSAWGLLRNYTDNQIYLLNDTKLPTQTSALETFSYGDLSVNSVACKSTTSALKLPRLDTSTRNGLTGMVGGELIYNTTDSALNIYTNEWLQVSTQAAPPTVFTEPFMPAFAVPVAGTYSVSSRDADGGAVTIRCYADETKTQIDGYVDADLHFAYAFNRTIVDRISDTKGWGNHQYTGGSGNYGGTSPAHQYDAGAGSITGAWIEVEFEWPKPMDRYALFTAFSSQYRSTDFIVLGSNDGGVTWDSMHAKKVGYTVTYTIDYIDCTNTGSYKKYRLIVAKTVSGIYNIVMEWEPLMYGASVSLTTV